MRRNGGAEIKHFITKLYSEDTLVDHSDGTWPRISIVTPSYNQGCFLERMMLSVLNQGYPNLEYIIMDGGSTDETGKIIKKYESFLAYWVSEKDKGQADAVYRGFERSTGEILAYLNSDDLLLPGALERVARYFKTRPEKEWVVGGSVIIDPEDRPLKNRIGLPMCNLGIRVCFSQLLFGGCHFNQPASFWRRDPFFATGGFDRSLRFCFDRDLYLRLAQRQASGNIREFLACFRVHPDSKTCTIQSVCTAERESLWRKYGRYERNKIYSDAAASWHKCRSLIGSRTMQTRLLLGLLHCPV